MISKILTKLLTNIYEGSFLLPRKGSASAAGYDLRAAIDKPLILRAGETCLVPCGIAMEIPEGYVGLVCPRSGLAVKHGITVLNSPGVIDSDYRGQMHVLLHKVYPHKSGRTDLYIPEEWEYAIQPGERIGQLLIVKIENQWDPEIVEDLSSTERGSNGFGSTGK